VLFPDMEGVGCVNEVFCTSGFSYVISDRFS
jgi:hypothetical protein